MAFHTKKEKYAYVRGLMAGNKGKKPFRGRTRRASAQRRRSAKEPAPGAYGLYGRIKDDMVDDLHGPVVFF